MKPLRSNQNQPGRKPSPITTRSYVLHQLLTEIQDSNISQTSVCEAGGFSDSAFYWWKTGKSSPSLINLETLATVLGYRIELVKGVPEEVTEIDKAANNLLNTLWAKIYSSQLTLDENWGVFERTYPGVIGLHHARAAIKAKYYTEPTP